MLCWVVNDLYKWRKSLALVLFPALCVMQYNLGTAPRVGVERRRRIAALVASALRYEPIAVPTDLHVLHPAVFLACNCPGIQLKDICDSLGLNNLKLLSLSASEVEEFALGPGKRRGYLCPK
ncbi:hypothetical protein HYQ46_005506 [Verticillium longisporum]|nr:hypothetical protein HYQ44_002952 [Verticillium longisporum]KAG7152799.1 hypothetical protein HYQ46_005506 [Verticillium longisporum]